MNEKALGILNQYDFEVYKTIRARGGIVLSTSRGVKIIYECNKADIHYLYEDRVTQALSDTGFNNIDTYFYNIKDELISTSEDSRKYVVKNWFDATECEIKNLNDICQAVSVMAKMHLKMNEMSLPLGAFEEEDILAAASIDTSVNFLRLKENKTDLANQFSKRTKELKMINNYLKNKKKKNEFERMAQENFGVFYEEALQAVEMMKELKECEEFEKSFEANQLCHGSYTYHNVLFSDSGIAVTNFDRCKNDFQIIDLYQFMRKLLEKNNWDIKLAYRMLDIYDNVKPLGEIDIKILGVLFAYPEKFWKIVNYYFNSNKSWIPAKSIEKLDTVVRQNYIREKFVETIA